MYYVYVLANEKGKIYIGYTSNIKERYLAHQRKEVKNTREGKWRLVYYEAYRDKKDALIREKHLKKSGQGRRWLKERIKNSLSTSE